MGRKVSAGEIAIEVRGSSFSEAFGSVVTGYPSALVSDKLVYAGLYSSTMNPGHIPRLNQLTPLVCESLRLCLVKMYHKAALPAAWHVTALRKAKSRPISTWGEREGERSSGKQNSSFAART